MRKKHWLILAAILLVGLLIRIYKIQSLPMYGDELTMVYDTYSIYKTGMDATGQKLPLTFRMGAGRPGGYIYFSVPFVAVFGPTVWGVRSLSLLSGLGIILLAYFIGRKLFNIKVGILASLLAAISPWEIYLSRGGFEAHFALFLALLGIYMFISEKYIPWAVAWGISILTYPTFKLTLPLMFIVLVLYSGYKKLLSKKIFWAGVLVLFAFGVITGWQTFRAGSEQRFLSENIFADKDISSNITQIVTSERNGSTLPESLKPIFINKEISYAKVLLQNYVANISPDFLILRGDGNPRNNPGEKGMLYLVDLVLILISLPLLWKEEKGKFGLLLSWILITPLATMFFPEAHGLRNGLMLPALIILSAYALSKLSKTGKIIVFTLIFIELFYILIRIYTIAPAKFASFWSSDARKIALEAVKSAKAGKKVTLYITKTDNIEYAYEVYAGLDPKVAIEQYGKLPKVFGNVTITDK